MFDQNAIVAKTELTPGQVGEFLRSEFDSVADVALLKGGCWSAAYRFVGDGRQLVVRFGMHRDDYERDALAGSWDLAAAPTPTVLAVGDAFDGCYAISTWVAGDGFDELPRARFTTAQESVMRAYEALASVALPGSGYGIWVGPSGNAPHATWADFLTAVPSRNDDRLRGWEERLNDHGDARLVFDRAQREVERLAPNCPNLRCVSHCDPLWRNILIDEHNRHSLASPNFLR